MFVGRFFTKFWILLQVNFKLKEIFLEAKFASTLQPPLYSLHNDDYRSDERIHSDILYLRKEFLSGRGCWSVHWWASLLFAIIGYQAWRSDNGSFLCRNNRNKLHNRISDQIPIWILTILKCYPAYSDIRWKEVASFSPIFSVKDGSKSNQIYFVEPAGFTKSGSIF